MYILDTDHLTFLEKADHLIADQIRRRVLATTSKCVATIVSYEEQLRGWLSVLAKARTVVDQVGLYRMLLKQLHNYCAMEVIEFDELAAVEFQRLRTSKIRIPTMDLKIAAIAISRTAILVTRNASDFIKVPNLKFEDWTKE